MVGPGFILLVIIWILCILLCIIFSRFEGSVAYAGILCVIAAVIITLALWFHPRGVAPDETHVIYDQTYLRRTLIVSVLGVMLFVGMIVVAALHVFDQRRPTPLKACPY